MAKLKRPRRVMLMVKAGQAVDDFIQKLAPILDPGDVIVDGGNSEHQVNLFYNVRYIPQYIQIPTYFLFLSMNHRIFRFPPDGSA